MVLGVCAYLLSAVAIGKLFVRQSAYTSFLSMVVLIYGVTVFSTDGNLITVSVRLTQMIAGGCFTRYIKQIKSIPLIGVNVIITIIAVLAQKYIHAVTVGFAVCWMIFIIISLLVECFPSFSAQ